MVNSTSLAKGGLLPRVGEESTTLDPEPTQYGSFINNTENPPAPRPTFINNVENPRAFASWLRKDSSVIMSRPKADKYLEQTDEAIATIVKNRRKHGHTVSYSSVNRVVEDTAVWHRRRHDNIAERAAQSRRFKKDGPYAKVYDADLVGTIEMEKRIADFVILTAIGIAMAFVGSLVSSTADDLLDRKIGYALRTMDGAGARAGFIVYVAVSVMYAVGAFLPVAFRPISAGSGIGEAKAMLNGIVIPKCASPVTGLCKAIGVIFSVAASLPVGLEGPMIHLGLVIGDNINILIPQKYSFLEHLRSDRSRIEFAAVGTAAGVAAAFRSPIAGVLFVMEEGCSYWSNKLSWRCFVSACATIITLYIIIQIGTPSNVNVTSLSLFAPSESDQSQFSFFPAFQVVEYPYFVLVGVAGGLLGAFFCVTNRRLAILRRDLKIGLLLKALEVILVTTVMSCLTWFLPLVLKTCSSMEAVKMNNDYFREFGCPEGQYNELATLLLNPLGGVGINLLFHENNDAFSIQTCVVAGLTIFFMLLIVFGTSISGGIFIPLLFSGACFGRAAGVAAGLDARTYAIVGSAACLGGVARVLISLTAIVSHTTSLSYFVTPIMVVTLASRIVGNLVSGRPGIYDIILQLREIPFLEEEPPDGAKHTNLRARNIMRTDFVAIPSPVKVGQLLSILKSCDDVDFPVVAHQGGRLVGSIERPELIALLTRREIFYNPDLEGKAEGDGEDTLTYTELDAARREARDVGPEGIKLEAGDAEKMLRLSTYVQIAPHTFEGHGSVERAYEKFRTLGLRSLLVLDGASRPIGVISRHELHLLEEVGMAEEVVKTRRRESCRYTAIS